MPRPKDTNLVVLQAYKKSHINPFEILKKPKKRDDSNVTKKKYKNSEYGKPLIK
jgi:hypothetical protein